MINLEFFEPKVHPKPYKSHRNSVESSRKCSAIRLAKRNARIEAYFPNERARRACCDSNNSLDFIVFCY